MSETSPSSIPLGPPNFDGSAAAWFFAESLDLFIITDQSSAIRHLNPAWEPALGWSLQDLIGRKVYDFVHPEDAAPLRQAGVTVRTTGCAQGTFRVRSKAGAWRWLSGRSQLSSGGALMATLRDVTEEYDKAEAQDRQKRVQSLIARTVGIAIFTYDPLRETFSRPDQSAPLGGGDGLVIASLADLKAAVPVEDWPALEERFSEVARIGGEGAFALRLRRLNGGLSHYTLTYRSEPHPSGLYFIHGLSQNVTASVEARDAALRGERMTRQAIKGAPFAAAIFDLDLRHLVVSETWCAILKLSKADLEGRTLAEVFPKARRRFINAQTKALAGETVTRAEDRLVALDGQTHWVRWEMQPWRGTNGEIAGVLAYLSDISALVAARREAQANARRLKLAVTAARAAVFEIDYVEKTVWTNQEFVRFTGRSLSYDEMIGVWPQVHPDDVAHVKQTIAALDTHRPMAIESRFMQADGSERWVTGHLEIIHDASGAPVRMVGLLLDIDERKRQELALRDAERQAKVATEAKSRFLANISHEIRTPLNGVLGVLQLIKRDRLDADDSALLDEGLSSGLMLTELLDDIVDFSKIETGQFELNPEPVDPAAVLVGITSLLEPAASAKGLTMRATADPDLGMISADPLRLRQALYNIMGNAVKFTPSGCVEARLTRCETPDGPRMRFEVQDTGVGVPEAAQSTLFERFEQADGSATRRFGGSGLGLAITKRLAEMMGGAVGFASRPGEGSTFWIEIGGEQVAAPPAAEDADIGDFRVLLVEDNPTNRLVISKLLQALGIVVETADDGAAGVAAAARGGFDLVLMDIQMPGMDGLEATRRIRAMNGPISETPVVAITANVMADQRSSYVAAGMDGVVAKPVSAAALLSEITRVAERRAA